MMKETTWTRMALKPAQTAGKMLLPVIGIFLLLSAWGGDCFGAQKASQDVMARWGKKVITRQDVEARIATLPMEYQMRFQSPEQIQEFLDGMIQMYIIGAEAREQKLEKDKAVAQRIEDTINSILVQEYMKKKMALAKKATDKDIETYYQAHKGEYLNPAQVQASHILIKIAAEAKPEEIAAAKAKTEDIRKEIEAGGDFAKLAEKYSDDPGSKANGGDLGFFTRDKMIPEFADAAFSLKKGGISQPVKTGYGFHLIKVTDIKPEKQQTLEECTPAIQTSILNARREAIVDKELNRLKKKYNVRITTPPDAKPEAKPEAKK